MEAINPLRAWRQGRMTLEQFGASFGVNKTTAMRWEGGQLPAERVLAVSKLTGIPPHRLRPDIYPAALYGRDPGDETKEAAA